MSSASRSPSSSLLLTTTLLAALLAAASACSDEQGSGDGGAAAAGGSGAAAGAGGSGGYGGNSGTGAGGTTGTAGAGGTTSGSGGLGGAGGQPPEWGQLAGSCGQIDDGELSSPSPFLFDNEIDFGLQDWDYDLLSPGGQQIYDDGNAGGSSLYSEVLAFEVLHRCELAELLKTETFIAYQPSPPAITDILVSIDGHKVGVSVVRAFHYPPAEPYTVAEAQAKMEEKLLDIQLSSAAVLPADAWTKQILHVIAWDAAAATSVTTAVQQIDPSIKADTIVLVTATHGTDEYIYLNN